MSQEKTKNQIYKPKPISGFPEWLPEWQIVFLGWMDRIRDTFETYGYCNIETASVEELEVLSAKGEVDKELYVLERLHKDEGSKEARLGLHFDQTVPLARYVAQNFNDLVFPFKRYQMQKVWRGERPQKGRMREFYQCDIDVIAVDQLPLSFDAEVASIIHEALSKLDIGRVCMRISNRKILLGLLQSIGIKTSEDQISVTRIIDKLDKIGLENVQKELSDIKINSSDINKITDIISVSGQKSELEKISTLNAEMEEGASELIDVLSGLSHLDDGAVRADLSIVRGLDYYTGTVYETNLIDIPEFTSSVCSGGRYDDLAGSFINRHLPGVGVSIGLSRLFDVLKQENIIQPGAKSPADILVAYLDVEARKAMLETAQILRKRGFKVETYHAPQKLQKQLSYAEKKGIPYVWFPNFGDQKNHEIKDLKTRTQVEAHPQTWQK